MDALGAPAPAKWELHPHPLLLRGRGAHESGKGGRQELDRVKIGREDMDGRQTSWRRQRSQSTDSLAPWRQFESAPHLECAT